jgi:hypothetical protein
MHVKADCTEEELDDLLGYSKQHSPTCNTAWRLVLVVIDRAKT